MYSPFSLVKKYFQYYLLASNAKGHGIHSPFVFEWIKNIKNDKQVCAKYNDIETLRKELLADKSMIEVEDFGAGSGTLKSNLRAVHKMAASSLKPKKFAQLLYRMIKYYKPLHILELGTSFGITSSYLASANPESKIISIEGATSVAAIAQKNFDLLGLKNIELLQGNFEEMLPVAFHKMPVVDFVFVDGNHRREPTLNYFKQLLNHIHKESIVILDDIHWSREMEEAWEIIKDNDAVTLTIDLFFIGIVFFKKDFKEKQHFCIRF